jgi:hypothetical protein
VRDQVGNAADLAGDDRQAARHRFHDRERHRLRQRRRDDDVEFD